MAAAAQSECLPVPIQFSALFSVRFGWPLLNRFRQTGEEGKEEDAAADKRGKRWKAEMH